jgi:hypothetical protein
MNLLLILLFAAGIETPAWATSSAYVGIGTPAPTSMLTVEGDTSNTTTNALAVVNSTVQPLMTIRNDGVVSMGNSGVASSTAPLTVAGNVSNGGSAVIYANNVCTTSSCYGVMGVASTYWGALGRGDGYSFVGVGPAWNSVNSWSGVSDARLKEDIVSIPYGIDTIDKLRPVTFHWKKDSSEYQSAKGFQLGLIAQEVEKVVPESVTNIKWPTMKHKGEPNLNEKLGEVMSVDYVSFVPVLIKGVQDLHQMFQSFVNRLAGHDARLAELERENFLLRQYLCQKDPAAYICQY